MRDASLTLGRTKRRVAWQDKKKGRSAGQKEGSLGRTRRGRSAGQEEELLGRTDGWKGIATKRFAQLKSRKSLSATQNRGDGLTHTTFQTLSLRSVIKYTKSLLLRGFSEK